jgi:hypothetical protein
VPKSADGILFGEVRNTALRCGAGIVAAIIE